MAPAPGAGFLGACAGTCVGITGLAFLLDWRLIAILAMVCLSSAVVIGSRFTVKYGGAGEQ